MPQAPARFTADELDAALLAGETIDAFAARKGVTTAWAAARLRRAKIARGEAVKAANDFSWQDKLRFQPSREAVERLYRTHGREAVEERWGRDIGRMRKLRPA